jgi:hypothetical protein
MKQGSFEKPDAQVGIQKQKLISTLLVCNAAFVL